jgi:hypothetical protein
MTSRNMFTQNVAFNFSWRTVSELFGVLFQDYLAYTASACAYHKTVPRRFNYFIGDEVKVVNLPPLKAEYICADLSSRPQLFLAVGRRTIHIRQSDDNGVSRY